MTVLLATTLFAGLAQAAPPLQNLVVEMRVSEQQTDQQHEARGAVVVGSRGARPGGGASVSVQAGSSQQAQQTSQRVLVLNGGRATLSTAQGLLVDDTEVWWSPWGAGAAVRSQWIELVNGIETRPSWPGGAAPVTVEVAAQRSMPGGTTPPAQWTLVTTVQAPLGEWVTVAQVAGRQAAAVSGGFGASTSSRQRSLQLRVSLP